VQTLFIDLWSGAGGLRGGERSDLARAKFRKKEERDTRLKLIKKRQRENSRGAGGRFVRRASLGRITSGEHGRGMQRLDQGRAEARTLSGNNQILEGIMGT